MSQEDKVMFSGSRAFEQFLCHSKRVVSNIYKFLSSFSCQSVPLNCYTIPNGGLEMVEGGIGFYYWH